MKLSFLTLVIENFGSFVGKHELSLASYGAGLQFLRGRNLLEPRLGPNGVGKSTLFSALCWCLYGRTPEGLRNPDIQSRFGPKNTTVTLTLRHEDDEPFVVERTTHPNRLRVEGVDVGQDEVDTFVSVPYEVFINTVILGQGLPLFFDLQPKAKMDLFGAVLNLERWDTRAEAASSAARALDAQCATIKGELLGLEATLARTATALATAQENWRNWRDEQARAAAEHATRLAALKERYEATQNTAAAQELAYDSAATELKALQNDYRTKGAPALEQLLASASTAGAEAKVTLRLLAQLQADYKDLGETDECPTCGQPLKGTALGKHKAELRAKIKTAKQAVAVAEEKLAEKNAAVRTLQDKLSRSRDAERRFQHKAEEARDALDRAQRASAALLGEIKQMETAAKERERAANPYTDQVRDLKADTASSEKAQKQKERELKQLVEQCEHTRFWVKGFKDVRLYLIEDVLQELELTTNAALADIGLIDWTVQYVVEKETKSGTVQRGLNVLIQSPRDKDPVRWESWSGGERQRLRLVGALALSEVLLMRAGVEPDLEILDEPTAHLSADGVRDLCEFLALRAETLGRAVWLIDHTAQESSAFTSTLTVIKDKKGSRLEA